ncbi:MAG: HlyD family efflux transporter periplasmic adaptor subunit, partial [Cyanobacteria bacterium J06648_11]
SEAELDLARTTVDRDRVLIQSGAIAQSVLDESESSFRTATASLAQARSAFDSELQSEQSAIEKVSETQGDFSVRQADLASLQASRAELVNALEQAQTDLDACTLRAPFRGRVTKRYSERGSYINAGSAIVQLTMETAVKVVVTLSPEQEREISLGTQLPVYVDVSSSESVPVSFPGTVFEKASVADSGTRTFRVGLILPNLVLNGVDDQDDVASASVGDLFPALTLPEAGSSGLFVHAASVLTIDGQTFVLALPRGDENGMSLSEAQVPIRVPITLTDEWRQLDTATLRGVEPTDAISPGDPLVLNPTPDAERGVRIGSLQYAFRPGDVVRVGLAADLPETGFWIPSSAIVSRSGESLVFTTISGVA